MLHVLCVCLLTERVAFTDCTLLPLTVTSDSDAFAPDSNSDHSRSAEEAAVDTCTSITVTASRVGHSVISASYRRRGVTLESTVVVAAFEPLLV